MCWESKKIKIKIAKKDISVYKVVHAYKDNYGKYSDKCRSFYKYFEYILKVRNTTQMAFTALNTKNTFVGINGFHSYSNKMKYAVKNGSVLFYSSPLFFGRSFSEYYSFNRNPIIVKCHIPKGSKYAINKFGEIISNDIVLDEYVEI